MMRILSPKQPYKVIHWEDKENTGAVGWIVIHNLVNGVSGGGLFMHKSASLQEVKDLACTMRYKNALLQPMIGGGKGGIKFDANDPRAKSVLKRFLKDNLEIISTQWCTGGDLNTTTSEITKILAEISNLQSPFHCLATLLNNEFKTSVNLNTFNKNLNSIENQYFTVDQSITGYSIFKMLEERVDSHQRPKIIVQGFGKVGKAFCYYAQQHCDIVGICERDWYLYNAKGIEIDILLKHDVHTICDDFPSLNIVKRHADESEEDFLYRFLCNTHADIFCPCAVRYCINQRVLDVLINHTFVHRTLVDALIIAGANDVFKQKDLIITAFANKITVIPEWLSNPGSAILFMEALQYRNKDNYWNIYIKKRVASRVKKFMSKAINIADDRQLNLYDACCYLAHTKIESGHSNNLYPVT